jgi:hypothetical protein
MEIFVFYSITSAFGRHMDHGLMHEAASTLESRHANTNMLYAAHTHRVQIQLERSLNNTLCLSGGQEFVRIDCQM